jgi:isopenicillin-N epimerase
MNVLKTDLKNEFLLDPEVIFLNHGSFGACPRSVFEVYQDWQRQLERQPVDFIGRRSAGLLAEARARLAEFLGVDPGEVVYTPNPTTAINIVARSLELHPGDEILATNHEYGAMDRTWRYICRQRGAVYINHPIPLPVCDPLEFVERFWAGVTPRTRVVFLSHITSPTALTFPVEEICRRAREAGLLSIVDGAHAPGQIPLDLHKIGADIYAGACHKWLCAPKGSAFLYARRETHAWLEPLVVSFGYDSECPVETRFVKYHEWQGTRDIAAYLSVPAAIDFQASHDWAEVRQACHALACDTRARLEALGGQAPVCSLSPRWFHQMFVARLPDHADLERLSAGLRDDYHIVVPVGRWNEINLMRVSFQAYNSQADADRLVEALEVHLG